MVIKWLENDRPLASIFSFQSFTRSSAMGGSAAMTPFKTLILENEYCFVGLKLLAVVGSVAMIGVITILSLEMAEKWQEWRRNRILMNSAFKHAIETMIADIDKRMRSLEAAAKEQEKAGEDIPKFLCAHRDGTFTNSTGSYCVKCNVLLDGLRFPPSTATSTVEVKEKSKRVAREFTLTLSKDGTYLSSVTYGNMTGGGLKKNETIKCREILDNES